MINRCDAAISLIAYDCLSLIASDCLPHQVTPPPLEHGWLFFADALCYLFKEASPTKPFKVTLDQHRDDL